MWSRGLSCIANPTSMPSFSSWTTLFLFYWRHPSISMLQPSWYDPEGRARSNCMDGKKSSDSCGPQVFGHNIAIREDQRSPCKYFAFSLLYSLDENSGWYLFKYSKEGNVKGCKNVTPSYLSCVGVSKIKAKQLTVKVNTAAFFWIAIRNKWGNTKNPFEMNSLEQG